MLIDIEWLVVNYGLDINGVLHVGAHQGEEAAVYNRLGVPVWWVEANPTLLDVLKKKISRYKNQEALMALVTDKPDEIISFNVANNGQSSSILEFGTHEAEHPEVKFVDQIQLSTTTIDKLFEDGLIGEANFLNLDIQGAELLALKGAAEYLENVLYIYSEVNRKELYKGCAIFSDVENWLRQYGFERIEVKWTKHGWGDAVWVKRG